MADLEDGEQTQMQGSGAQPYLLRNTGGVYSCSCPAWRNQSHPIERRTCKHLRKLRGDAAEEARVGLESMKPGGAAGPGQKAGAGASAAKPAAAAKATAPPVLLAHPWENDVDLTGWWMSEKLDGVRAYWDGARFWSRLGNEFRAPDWFVQGLPAFPLDGELWSGRKEFQRTVSIVRRADRSKEWAELRFVVFDAPGHAAAFEDRLEHVRASLQKSLPKYAQHHAHERCESLAHLRTELARVEALGGEGLMLRKPGSKYEVGRSHTLLKVKSFKDDEARVVAHLPGAGKHKGRLGALEVELRDGTRFSVGTGFSDKERSDPPPVGSIITCRYQELSKDGVPRFPSYVGVRIDLAFEKKPAAAPPPKPEPAGAARRFEKSTDTGGKFWELRISGAQLTVRFGKLGAAGVVKTRTFGDPGAAAAEAADLVQRKREKGYLEKS